jgi:hypothetical protein
MNGGSFGDPIGEQLRDKIPQDFGGGIADEGILILLRCQQDWQAGIRMAIAH